MSKRACNLYEYQRLSFQVNPLTANRYRAPCAPTLPSYRGGSSELSICATSEPDL